MHRAIKNALMFRKHLLESDTDRRNVLKASGAALAGGAALAVGVKAADAAEPLIALEREFHATEKAWLAANDRAEEISMSLPHEVRSPKVKFGNLHTGEGREPLYAYSEEQLIEERDRWLEGMRGTWGNEHDLTKSRKRFNTFIAKFRAKAAHSKRVLYQSGHTTAITEMRQHLKRGEELLDTLSR